MTKCGYQFGHLAQEYGLQNNECSLNNWLIKGVVHYGLGP
jgi:hypothetical protein